MSNIKIKIKYVYEQGTHKINEDSILIGKNIFGVFDGFSGADEHIYKYGHTGGYQNSNICKDIFKNEDLSLYKLAVKANSEIRNKNFLNNINISKKENLPGTAIAVIKINKNNKTFDWIQISDSLILVIYKNNKYKVLVKDYDHDIKILTVWKKLADKGEKNLWNKTLSESIKMRRTMNKKFGILNGEIEANKFLKQGTMKFHNIKHILLFTDGLFLPKENPKLPDNFDSFVQIYLKGGLLDVKKNVRKIEKSDPDCIKYPRFKKHDDITGISLTFEDNNG